MSIEAELAEVLLRIEPPLELKSYVAGIIKDAVELCRYNEDGIALENLCDNLFEEGVRITPGVRDRLQALCDQFHVDAGRRALLDALASGSTGLSDG